jgi:hypothetical protein
MAQREWTIGYFLKGNAPVDDSCTFGCGVEGVAGNDGATVRQWGIYPVGEVLAGTYDSVLEELGGLVGGGFHPDAAVVFFAKAPGMEDFLRQAAMLLPGTPFGGGGAAFNPAIGSGELMPAAKDVILLLIKDDRYRFTNFWRNVHEATGRSVSFRASDTRTILALRDEAVDQPAKDWYDVNNKALGFRQESYENLVLASPEGWNLHASPEGEFALHMGTNLPCGGELMVRMISDGAATERVTAFCNNENTLVFGCAGLQSLLVKPVQPGDSTLAGYLHGEVITVNGSPRFTNLMMSGLKADYLK